MSAVRALISTPGSEGTARSVGAEKAVLPFAPRDAFRRAAAAWHAGELWGPAITTHRPADFFKSAWTASRNFCPSGLLKFADPPLASAVAKASTSLGLRRSACSALYPV